MKDTALLGNLGGLSTKNKLYPMHFGLS